jgi:ankyrin repeat protein
VSVVFRRLDMAHRISAFVAALILTLSIAVAPVAADPIHDAAKAGEVAEVKSLLAAGSKVDARTEHGHTPLHMAKTAEVAEVLLKAGSKVDARTESGYTPLYMARTAEIAKALLKAGANVDARTESSWTPLYMARTAEIAEVLLKAGANISSRTKSGWTPLHSAVNWNRADVVEFLLAKGADAKARVIDFGNSMKLLVRDPSLFGDTPFDLAKKNGMLKGTDAYWLLHEAQYD